MGGRHRPEVPVPCHSRGEGKELCSQGCLCVPKLFSNVSTALLSAPPGKPPEQPCLRELNSTHLLRLTRHCVELKPLLSHFRRLSHSGRTYILTYTLLMPTGTGTQNLPGRKPVPLATAESAWGIKRTKRGKATFVWGRATGEWNFTDS